MLNSHMELVGTPRDSAEEGILPPLKNTRSPRVWCAVLGILNFTPYKVLLYNQPVSLILTGFHKNSNAN